MIIDTDLLKRFEASCGALEQFAEKIPAGIDITALCGERRKIVT